MASSHRAKTRWLQNDSTPNSRSAQRLHDLAHEVMYNLQHQHDWTDLSVLETSSTSSTSTLPSAPPAPKKALPRPLLRGLPPRPLYVHPDLQIEMLKAEHAAGKGPGAARSLRPEAEWVLPMHVTEKGWSLRRFAEIFAAVETVPPSMDGRRTGDDLNEEGKEDEKEDEKGLDNNDDADDDDDDDALAYVGQQWRGTSRPKRILLAMVHEDSTVVYYVMHDGIVKPRQN